MKRDTSIVWRKNAVQAKGLRVAIIGGTGGIGRALAQTLAAAGASVTAVGQTFRDQGTMGIEFVKADLSLMREARRVAEHLPSESLDMVIFTTGIMAGPHREVTSEGIERDFAVSYLNRFVMLQNLAPRLGNSPRSTGKPRIFLVGFPGTNQTARLDDLNSEKSYRRFSAHSNTVAGNEALVLNLAERFPNLAVFGLNPGFVKTNIRANLFGSKLLLNVMEGLTAFMTSTPEDYAARVTPLLTAPEIANHSGAMFNSKAQAILPSAKVAAPGYAEKLLAASADLLAKHKLP